MRPDPETIRSLVAFLEEEGLEEVCYEAAGARIRVRKQPTMAQVVPVGAVAPQPDPVAAPSGPKTPVPKPPSRRKPEHWRDLLSPMSGIFYRATGPGTEPFANVGDVVDVDQTIGLVEAMKTFNEVAAEFPGRVVEFYVQDADPVQMGQPILALERLEV